MRAVGCAIAVLSLIVGVIGGGAAWHHWQADNIERYMTVAVVGGVIGFTIFVVGEITRRQ